MLNLGPLRCHDSASIFGGRLHVLGSLSLLNDFWAGEGSNVRTQEASNYMFAEKITQCTPVGYSATVSVSFGVFTQRGKRHHALNPEGCLPGNLQAPPSYSNIRLGNFKVSRRVHSESLQASIASQRGKKRSWF